MSTGNAFANIAQKRLLGYRDLEDRFLQYLRSLVLESHSRVWDASAVHDVALEMQADGSNAFKIVGTSIATDGEGRLLRISDAAANAGINFENTNSVDYYVALKYTDVPAGSMELNPRSGQPQYEKWEEEIGENGTPDLVTDNGNGTITFRVDSVTEAGVSNAGREVLVYKLIAAQGATTFAVAVETCTVSWSGTNNEITTAAALGQSTVSEVAGDYAVVMLGPTVKRYVDLRTVSGYVFVGIITGNGGTPAVFDHTDQNLATVSLSQLANIAAKAPNGRAKIDVRPAAGEDGIYQIASRDEDGNIKFAVDEDGNMEASKIPYFNEAELKTPDVVDSGDVDTRYMNVVPFVKQGKRKIFCCDTDVDTTSQAFIDIYDVETMTLDERYNLYSQLPDELTTPWVLSSPIPWKPFDAIVEGDIAYIMFVSEYWSVGSHILLQAFDINDWTRLSAWPADGLYVATRDLRDDASWGHVMLSIGDYLFVSGCDYNSEISKIDKADGTTVETGEGDTPETDLGIYDMCTDGDYIYANAHSSSTAEPVWLCSWDLSDLSVGCGGTGWPRQLYATTGSYPRRIAYGKGLIVSIRSGGSIPTPPCAIATKENADFAELWMGYYNSRLRNNWRTIFYSHQIEFNGVDFWMLHAGDVSFSTATDKRRLFISRFELGDLVSKTDSTEMIVDRTASRRIHPVAFSRNAGDDAEDTGEEHGLLKFDGKDVWIPAERQASSALTGKVFRLPNALFQKGGALVNEKGFSIAYQPNSSPFTIYAEEQDVVRIMLTSTRTLAMDASNLLEDKEITFLLETTAGYTLTVPSGVNHWHEAGADTTITCQSTERYIIKCYIRVDDTTPSYMWRIRGPLTD